MSRVRCKLLYLAIFISSCGSDDDKVIEQPGAVNTDAISSSGTEAASMVTSFIYTLITSNTDANTAPTITIIANNSGDVGSAYCYTLTANDMGADTLVCKL